MHRRELTIDLGAVRRNARALLHALGGARAVGGRQGRRLRARGGRRRRRRAHGRRDARSAPRPSPRRSSLRTEFPTARIVVLGPASNREVADARDARLELTVADGEIPEGVRVHLKLDTGMGRWGLAELPAPAREVVGLMSHLASADCDPAFTELQIERFREATAERTRT